MKATFTIHALLSAAALLVQPATSANCGAQACGPDTPCCVKGFCNRNAQYCMPYFCEAENSHTTESCWSTAHCVDMRVDFSSPASFANIADYNGNPETAMFVSQFEPSNARINNGALEISLVKGSDGKGFGATVVSTRAVQFGKISTVVSTAVKSPGVVSSFIVRNDKIGDEIDFEFVGQDILTAQSNYYWHDVLDYKNMVRSMSIPDTSANLHTYTIDWKPDQLTWAVNGNVFRTLNRADTWDPNERVFKYPDSEGYVGFSTWDGGSGAQGTRDWAGGYMQWDKGPFVMRILSVDIECFYKGNETTYTPPEPHA